MAEIKTFTSGKKWVVRLVAGIGAVWFFLSFLNDWAIISETGYVPIVDTLSCFTPDPLQEDWENKLIMFFHAGVTGIFLFFLLHKKKK